MQDSHYDALQYLVAFVGFLILAIALPFILKAFKKKKPTGTLPETTETAEGLRTAEQLKAEKRPAAIDVGIKPAEPVVERPISLEEKLKNTKSSIWGRMRSVFDGRTESEALDQVEEILYTSDIGPKTVENLLEKIRMDLSASSLKNFDTLSKTLRAEMSSMITPFHPSPIRWNENGPTVILVLGVNGVGKTTTIGKLAALWASEGKKVMVAAGDTFRAAAASQLKVWSERAQVEIFAPEHTKDPSGVAFEAVQKGVNEKFDVVIVDTAGRLHTQDHLMEELKKIKRVVGKALEGAPHEAWIVLDANSGQNALIQAKMFNQAIEITGAIVTKMDGTAKGGIIIGLHDELKIPVKKIGVGEKLEDLRDFKPEEFLNAIL